MNSIGRRSILILCVLVAAFLSVNSIVAQNTSSGAVGSENIQSASNAASEPPSGKLVYSDDFSSSKSGWPIYTTGDLLATYKNGKYHITAVPPNYWDGINAPNANFSDFTVEVEAGKEAGTDDNVYGVFVRNIDPGSFYAFVISSDGYYEYAKEENETWVTPSNWTKSSAIKLGNETNLIRVDCIGGRMSFYANGEKLGDYTDNSFAYGGIGLWAGSQTEGNVTIGFDNLNVWAFE
jgi:hypothetical protein